MKVMCLFCKKQFDKKSFQVKRSPNHFCSQICRNNYRISINRKEQKCCNCEKLFSRTIYNLNDPKKKSNRCFCSRSCSVTYNNKHKTKGIRISKIEIYIKQKLTFIYPNIQIHYNKKTAINSELDIYFPTLKLAFEINGIFHYYPIFGEQKLKQTTDNDNRKFQDCIQRGIELCAIDISKQKHFNQKTSIYYLNLIIKKVDSKLK